MRSPFIHSLTFAALLLAGCGGNPPADNATGNEAAPEDRFTVRAGPVANAQIGALSGTFQMLKSGAPDAIPSSGMGGACLVFDPAALGYTRMAAMQCTTNKDCSDTGEGSAGYCDPDRKCWARPKGDLDGGKTCNRPLQMTAATLNPVPKQPVDAASLDVKAGTKVRVVACLNKGGPPFPPPRPPCGLPVSDDRIELFGPVATVR